MWRNYEMRPFLEMFDIAVMNKQIHGVRVKDYFTNLASKEVDVEENNPSYRCAKGRIHIYPLTKALFLLNIGVWLLAIGIMFPWSILVFWIPLLYFLITIYALKQKSATCMWPAIIHSVMLLLIWASATIVLFSTALFSTQTFLDTFGQGHHEDFVVRLFIVLTIKIVMVLIGLFLVYQCYAFNLCRKYFDIAKNADVNLTQPEEATELQTMPDKTDKT
ncbi:hypothetical protein Tcan_13410 [Toxocara canis]|uniref:Uncharacterized protein n=2 Tax=Toxocara canis TaxID=6265 RepID=A0A0B2VBZ1_TOXCA|nr:hypothetical protein Tcan_13410 [Toxocara canis]VDM45011.1 unnamed protein product [Toxocara canis]